MSHAAEPKASSGSANPFEDDLLAHCGSWVGKEPVSLNTLPFFDESAFQGRQRTTSPSSDERSCFSWCMSDSHTGLDEIMLGPGHNMDNNPFAPATTAGELPRLTHASSEPIDASITRLRSSPILWAQGAHSEPGSGVYTSPATFALGQPGTVCSRVCPLCGRRAVNTSDAV